MKIEARKDYDGSIFDDNKQIKYRITDHKRITDSIIQFFIIFYDENDSSLGVFSCSDKQHPLSYDIIKETYFELVKK